MAWVRRRIDALDCCDYAKLAALGLVGAAQHEFERSFGRLAPSRHRSFLEQMLHWVVERHA